MKRSTKKVIFFSSMMLTIVSLFAFGGKHHHFANRYVCGHGCYQSECREQSSTTNHEKETFDWNEQHKSSSETH